MKPAGAYPFTAEFQMRIVGVCLSDRSFYSRHSRHLSPQHFTAPGLADAFRSLAEYHEKYRAVPSKEMFVELVEADAARRKLKPAVAEELVRVARAAAESPVGDLAYVSEKLVDWARSQVIAQTAMRLAQLYEQSQATGEPATDDMRVVMQDAMAAVPSAAGGDYLNYFDDLVPRVYSDFNALKVTTGYPTLDDKLEGGVDRGEEFVFLGGPSMGKTSFLVGTARGMLLHRLKPLVFTNEVSPRRWAGRVDRAITGKTRSEIQLDPKRAERAIRRVRQVTGQMFIKGFPTGSAAVSDLESTMDELRDLEGFEPDGLIVDYADELRSERYPNDYRLGLVDVYRQLRALAQRRGLPMFTASQAGKQAEGKKIVNMKDAAEAYAKNFVADIVVALCQTDEEAALPVPEHRLYGAKNREGARRFNLRYVFDAARGIIVPAADDEARADKTLVRRKEDK